jgi:superfamily II DNA or RNA helicase
VQAVGDGEYAGFELDGDGRFLLGDFTVTHNTEIAVGLVLRVPTRWLFLVHKKDLLHQTVERFVKRAKGVLDLDPENDAATDDLSSPEALAAVGAGRIGDGEWIEGERFTVATFQTLYAALKDPSSANYSKAKKLLESVGGMIVDECHTLPADSFVKVANMTKNAYWRIGMSGTPLARGDKRSLMAIGCLGEIIYRLEPKTLIDRGLLAMPIIKMIEVNHTVNPETAPPTFQGVYGRYVVQSTRRNKALTEICKLADKPALLFVKEVKHGKILQDRLEREGIKSEFIWGQKETSQRKAAVERLLRGEIEVLICSVIFQEGTDIPELKSVIIASSGKSIIATLQRIGRGMRMSEGKGNTFEVWDIEDAGIDSLSKHSRARRKAYEKEGYKVGYAQISSLKSKVAQ